MAEAPEQAAEEEAKVVPADWKNLCLPNQIWGQTVLGGRSSDETDDDE